MARKNLLKKFLTGVVVAGLATFAIAPADAFAAVFGPFDWNMTWISTDSGTVAK